MAKITYALAALEAIMQVEGVVTDMAEVDHVARFPDGGLWHFFGPPKETFARVQREIGNRYTLAIAGVSNDHEHPTVHIATIAKKHWESICVPEHLFYTGFDYVNYLAIGNGVVGANMEGGENELCTSFLQTLAMCVFGTERRVIGAPTMTSTDLFLAPATRPRKLFVWKRDGEPSLVSPPFETSSSRDTFLGGVIVRCHIGTGEVASVLLTDVMNAQGRSARKTKRSIWNEALIPESVEDISLGADDGNYAIVTTTNGFYTGLSVDRSGRARYESIELVAIPDDIRALGTLVRIAGDTVTFVKRTPTLVTATNVRINDISDLPVRQLLNRALWSASMA